MKTRKPIHQWLNQKERGFQMTIFSSEKETSSMIAVNNMLKTRDFSNIRELVRYYAVTHQLDDLTPIFLITFNQAIRQFDPELLNEVLHMLQFENLNDLSVRFLQHLVIEGVLTENYQYT